MSPAVAAPRPSVCPRAHYATPPRWSLSIDARTPLGPWWHSDSIAIHPTVLGELQPSRPIPPFGLRLASPAETPGVPMASSPSTTRLCERPALRFHTDSRGTQRLHRVVVQTAPTTSVTFRRVAQFTSQRNSGPCKMQQHGMQLMNHMLSLLAEMNVRSPISERNPQCGIPYGGHLR